MRLGVLGRLKSIAVLGSAIRNIVPWLLRPNWNSQFSEYDNIRARPCNNLGAPFTKFKNNKNNNKRKDKIKIVFGDRRERNTFARISAGDKVSKLPKSGGELKKC